MPSMLDHESNFLVKALIAADTGSGKTGALASLLDAGYNVRVLDFDNGLSTVKNYVKDRSKLANMQYVTLRDELGLLAGRMIIKKANAFQRGMDALDKGGKLGDGLWEVDVPPLKEWTPQDVLVVDSFSMMGRSALYNVMQGNAAAMKAPEIQHYGTAMDNLEKFLGQVTSPVINCNVIITTHLMNIEGTPKLYPEALGSKLGPKIGRYFDNFWSISITGDKRTFKTKKDGLLGLKCAKNLKDEYPIEDGLAKIFKELLA